MVVELFLSVVAGAATAAAATKINSMRAPRIPTVGANSRLNSEIDTLDAQKRILEKSIARLYSDGVGLSIAKRDALLARYQEQLASVGAHMSRLVEASRHPDLGSLGDGLAALMDQKLSGIEDQFGKLYAKLDAEQDREQKPKVAKPKPDTQVAKVPSRPIEIPATGSRVELATLTTVPSRGSIEVPSLIAAGHSLAQGEPAPQHITLPTDPRPTIQERIADIPEIKIPEVQVADPPVPGASPAYVPKVVPTPGASPAPTFVPPKVDPLPIDTSDIDSEIDDHDSDAISKIKRDIQKALDKIDQAEVE